MTNTKTANFHPTPETMSVQRNDPNRKGHLASKKKFFGPHGRYSVAARHQELAPHESGQGAVRWVVEDANSKDGHGPTAIREAGTIQEAMAGL